MGVHIKASLRLEITFRLIDARTNLSKAKILQRKLIKRLLCTLALNNVALKKSREHSRPLNLSASSGMKT